MLLHTAKYVKSTITNVLFLQRIVSENLSRLNTQDYWDGIYIFGVRIALPLTENIPPITTLWPNALSIRDCGSAPIENLFQEVGHASGPLVFFERHTISGFLRMINFETKVHVCNHILSSSKWSWLAWTTTMISSIGLCARLHVFVYLALVE